MVLVQYTAQETLGSFYVRHGVSHTVFHTKNDFLMFRAKDEPHPIYRYVLSRVLFYCNSRCRDTQAVLDG